MKIFLDTANLEKIKKYAETGLIDGVTTNPSHLSKEGKDPVKQVLEICSVLKNGDISVEITEKEPKKVYEQAKKIADLAENIVVKVPCHADYYEIIKKLVQEDVKLNITLVFTVIQCLYMAKLGVKYISPFIGRWNDIDVDGIEIIEEARIMLDTYQFKTELLAASLRTVRDFHNCILAGADVVTLPLDVFEKSMEHPLTNRGMEKFLEDWQKLGIKQFP